MTNIPIDRPYFFDEGLRFECTKCGDCCSGQPGNVFLSMEEAGRIAEHLGMDLAAFSSEHLVFPDHSEPCLREKPGNDCPFLVDRRCSIYQVRPEQCRTYPFWLGILRSREAWERESANCPGMGRGRLYTRDEIMALCDMKRQFHS